MVSLSPELAGALPPNSSEDNLWIVARMLLSSKRGYTEDCPAALEHHRVAMTRQPRARSFSNMRCLLLRVRCWHHGLTGAVEDAQRLLAVVDSIAGSAE